MSLLTLKGHKSRDLTTKSHVIAIDEEGFGDKFLPRGFSSFVLKEVTAIKKWNLKNQGCGVIIIL